MKHILTLLSCAMLAFVMAPPALFAQVPTNLDPGDKGFVIGGTTSVASVAVGTAGTGYTSPPNVAFTGGSGSVQATGTATLKVVGSVTVTAGGSGYTVGDVLTVVGGTKTTAATLTVSTVSTGAVTAVTISNAGVYTAIPSNAVAVTGGTGSGATFTLGYGVGTVVVSTAGSGYLTTPTVTLTGGAGSSAAATATLAAVPAVDAKFSYIVPLADTVLSAITYSTAAAPPYSGDSSLIGKTLTKGVSYPVKGNAATIASGHAMFLLR